jgi:hypothetical protein
MMISCLVSIASTASAKERDVIMELVKKIEYLFNFCKSSGVLVNLLSKE